jgi:hypothetical protein
MAKNDDKGNEPQQDSSEWGEAEWEKWLSERN